MASEKRPYLTCWAIKYLLFFFLFFLSFLEDQGIGFKHVFWLIYKSFDYVGTDLLFS